MGLFYKGNHSTRSAMVASTLKDKNILPEDYEKIKFYTSIEKYSAIASRIIVFPILFVLYKRKFFDQKSNYFIREISTSLFLYSGIDGIDTLSNYFMWKNCHCLVQKYTNLRMQYREKQESKDIEEKDRLYD